jgi:lipoprotein NlpD
MRPVIAVALTAGITAWLSDRPLVRQAYRPPFQAAGPGYTVQPGDTLSGIAARHGVAMRALAAANGIAPPYLIRVGERLTIPRRTGATSRPVVQPLPRATATPSPPPLTNTVTAPRLVWPADGPVIERFGEGADPRGIAISAHAGAAVRAAAAGTVTFAGDEPQRYGSLVLVDHGGGWVSAYGHLGRLVVRSGERVRSGARLGFVGPSPTRDVRLHFELRRDNQPVDPLPSLPPRF